MQKYITRRNLLILNIILIAVLALTGFFGIIMPFLGARETDKAQIGDIPDTGTQVIAEKIRSKREDYAAITTNDLFVFKGQEVIIKTQTQHYDLTKVWELTSIIDTSAGLVASIRDKGQPDTVSKLPFSMYEVKVGDKLKSEQKPRIYDVEILEITREYVKYYRHDMIDKTEDERTFELRLW